MDAKRANLSEKKNLRDLILWWRGYRCWKPFNLTPILNLLTLQGYNGRHFPLWMANSTLEKIVEIKIIDCQKCMSLPELGNLSHLKTLWLQSIAVEYIIEDDVQNGNSEKIKFPSLKHLQLRDLPNLKGVSKEQESKEAFPNLMKLEIWRCSSLILPPISSLQKLETLTCSSSTLALFSEMDTLTELNVEIEEKLTCFSVETVVNFSNLESLGISGAKEISVSGEGEALQALKELRWLCIRNCETMRYLPKGLVQQLTTLMTLHIWCCPELVELPVEIKHLQNLELIGLSSLDKMACLPEALQHLSSLKYLHLINLPQLGSLPHWLHHLTSLRLMNVKNCAKVALLPALPNNLEVLEINGCPELERRCRRGSGEDWHKIANIPRLIITQ